ncbi:MAG: ferrochelatase [Arachnia sp.]
MQPSASKPAKVGVLFANLGTPSGTDYWSMRRFLGEFLSDQRVVDLPRWKWQPILQLMVLTRRPFTSGHAYRAVWNTEADESPMLTISKRQLAALRAAAAERFGDDVLVDLCMRYGEPSTSGAVRRLVDAGCTRLLFVPLYPQYAGATWATANDALFRALQDLRRQPAVRVAPEYYERPGYIAALAASVERAYAEMERRPDVLVASYHGLPRRHIEEGDPYLEHCLGTSRLLAERLGWGDGEIHTTFQSVFGREEWLKPYTIEHVAELAAEGKRIAVISPAFAADCVETLDEIDKLIRHAYEDAGGPEFHYVACLNDDAAHIEALIDVVAENLSGWVAPG